MFEVVCVRLLSIMTEDSTIEVGKMGFYGACDGDSRLTL